MRKDEVDRRLRELDAQEKQERKDAQLGVLEENQRLVCASYFEFRFLNLSSSFLILIHFFSLRRRKGGERKLNVGIRRCCKNWRR
jgi:hypothetical protein